MTVLVTGVAGFIGFHTAARLLAQGEAVLGIDNINAYYDPGLKKARLRELEGREGFAFRRLDIADSDAVMKLAEAFPDITRIVHLAGQPGVRHSIDNPYSYVHSNVMGHVVMLELGRRLKNLDHLVFASSSSVYGNSAQEKFSLDDRADTPTSLYGATKRADELIAHAYTNLFDLPMTGLRLFTVYGPWGRPDMAVYSFADAITWNRPIHVFNKGEMWRDFTYVDDIVDGILRALARPPEGPSRYKVYNLGNSRPVKVMDLIRVLEATLCKKAQIILEPMQKTEMRHTFADIDQSRIDLGYEPKITIEEGLPRFVEWYREYHGPQSARSAV